MFAPARPLVPPALSLAAGIWIGDAFPGHPVPVSLVSLGLAIPIAWRLRRTRFPLAALLIPFLYGYAALHTLHHAPPPVGHIWFAADGHKHRITALVASRPEIREGRRRFTAEILSVDGQPATGDIRISTPDIASPLRSGSRIEFTSSPRPLRDFATPGSLGYARRMALRGIRVSAYAREISLLARGTEDTVSFLERQRESIAAAIEAVASPPADGLLRALVLGQKEGIPEEWRDRFAAAGVAHLLAISGLHVGIVAAAGFGIFRWVLAFFPALLWRAWVRPAAMILALVPVTGYGLLAGMPAATLRATIMTIAVTIAFLSNRDQDGLNTVALAALTMLAVDPPVLFDVSFQLSFAAVIAIVMGVSRYPPPSEGPPLVRFTAAAIQVGLLATAGTLPLTMWHFHQASLNGIPANLVFIPLLGMAVVPLALTGALLTAFWIPAAMFFLKIAAGLAVVSLQLLPFFSDMPLAWRHTIIPTPVEMILYHGLLLLVLFPAGGPAVDGCMSGPRWWKWVAVILLLGMLLDAGWWLWRRFRDPECHLTILDVGQGSATLAELPGGFRMLVDGGGFPGRDAFDVGRWVVAPFLLSRRIWTIDLMVLSHSDADHLDGLLHVARHFSVKMAWLNGERSDSATFRELADQLESAGTRMRIGDDIPARLTVGDSVVEVLHPPRGQSMVDNGVQRRDNDRSLVLRLVSRGLSVLVPGDIEKQAEGELTDQGDIQSRVLIAPHHGCGTSSHPMFLEAVRPDIVVISCGWRNRFRCPTPDVLKRYESLGCRVYRTDRDGTVDISTDAGELVVHVCRTEDGTVDWGQGMSGNMY